MCSKKKQNLLKREAGFNSNCLNDKLPKYNALVDPNLRHHFESRARQRQLLQIGLVRKFSCARGRSQKYTPDHTGTICFAYQIDYEGRVIDLDKNKAKVAIIEKEFELAEREEFQRMQEEQEMRVSKQCSECEQICVMSRFVHPFVFFSPPRDAFRRKDTIN